MKNQIIRELLDISGISSSNTIGSYKDVKFDDLDQFTKQTLLPRGVRVHRGDVIDSIEMVYEKSDYKKGDSPFFHGGPNGYEKNFEIKPGDFLQKIDLEYGKYPFSTDPAQRNKDLIIKIKFTTREGYSSPWYGNECGKKSQLKGTPYTIDVGENNIICCFFGSTGKNNLVLHNYLQSIGVYYMTFFDVKSRNNLTNTIK